jgi:hypothetical protein
MSADPRKVVIKNVTAHWAQNLMIPRVNDDGSPGKYGMQVIVPKTHASVPAIKAALKAAKDKATLKGKIEINFHDGDAKDEDGEFIKEDTCYRDSYYFNASAKKPPGVVIGADRDPATEDDVYSGMGCAVSVTAFGYKREGRSGISWGLNNVWITDTTKPVLAGRATADKDFGDMDDVEIKVERKPKGDGVDSSELDDDLGL